MKNMIPGMVILWIMIGSAFTYGQTETPLTVRVLARDAKWIGTSMGGVEIQIRDLSTGTLLVSGITEGSTGDTDVLIHQSKTRYGQLSTEGAASFETSLSLAEPVFAEVKAIFRTAYTGLPITVSKDLWLIPGKAMDGDGVVLELPGFAMRINHPMPHQAVSLANTDEARIDLFMIMLCGCPIEPGGTWDSNPMEVEALVYREDELIQTIPFDNTETNRFSADLSNLPVGSYRVFVSAYDPRSKNTGVEKIQVTIQE